ncbi:MAG: lipopolysaccharide biosynthesis protein [Hydrogenophilales bacterium 16-64-46]|nr:MAG: lipopolysaccharide biosynthesis protein [Hydrogenophilales bacterium 12-64-13]OYZ07247.1 MAG: lipopolysaccharide biosynthesis protein [Hydrogenophilales bacterium 16-64-46]OZA37286.1 MAG: lipopolysaccharide biosynthesis protein [Hydrogenophilales bacterium 17-64-34]HQS98964.1 lipopolysaccharide biosynthesis protein [Thiobacillus sp.]
MSLGDTIRHGAKWVFIGNTGSQIINFALGLILARLLMPAEFGMVATILIFTNLAGFVAGGGMGQAIVRAKEATKRDYDLLFTLQSLIGLVIVAGFFIAAPWFGRWYDNPLYADMLRVAALSFLVRPFFNVPSNMLHRDMRFKARTVVQLTNLVIYNSIALSLAYAGYGPWSLILAGLFSAIAGALQYARYARWRPGLCLDFGRARELMRYGLLASGNNILHYIRAQLPTFVLSRTLGPEAIGLYNKAESLVARPHESITRSVYSVLFRALAKEQDNLDTSRYLFFRSLSLVAVYAMPFYIGFLWLAEPLIVTLFGQNWAGTADPLIILSLAGPLMAIENLSGAVLAARNRLGKELLAQGIMLAVTGGAIWLGIGYGMEGVAAAMVAARLYMSTHLFILAKRSLHARWRDLGRALLPATVLNGLMVAVLFAGTALAPASILVPHVPHILFVGLLGGLAYGLAFLYLPCPALASEAMRWKRKLKLARG